VLLGAVKVFATWEYSTSLIGNFLLTRIGGNAHETRALSGIIWPLCVYDAISFAATLISALSSAANVLT